jgi:hypothetical protein
MHQGASPGKAPVTIYQEMGKVGMAFHPHLENLKLGLGFMFRIMYIGEVFYASDSHVLA